MAKKSSSHTSKQTSHTKENLFLNRFCQIFDLPKPKALEILAAPSVITARINRLKIKTPDALLALAQQYGFSYEPLSWYPDGFVMGLPDGMMLGDLPPIQDGRIFVQNASSFLPVLALDPRPDEKILDACAAPGGKTSLIAAMTDNKAEIFANDGIATRLPKFKDVQKTLGFDVASLTTHPAQYIDKFLDETFDKILLDAQCGGEGMIGVPTSKSLQHWSMDRIEKYSYLQTKMLDACFKLLRPGGVMVYSTCTFAPEENEGAVNRFLKRYDDAVVEAITPPPIPAARPGLTQWQSENYDASLRGALRIMPGTEMEGFFTCRIRKLEKEEV